MLPPGTTMSCEEYRRYKRAKQERARREAMTPEELARFREKQAEYCRRYREKPGNKEKIRESQRKWREKPEGAAKIKAWYIRNRDHAIAVQRAYKEKRRREMPIEQRRQAARRYNENAKRHAAQWPDGVREDIREWRRRHMLTQAGMAAMFGHSNSYINKIENGFSPPSEKVLETIGIRWRPGEYMGPYRRRYGSGIDRNSICNHCLRTDCDWLREHVPVDGWRARPDEQNYGAKTWLTWHVEACPLYREDASRELY